MSGRIRGALVASIVAISWAVPALTGATSAVAAPPDQPGPSPQAAPPAQESPPASDPSRGMRYEGLRRNPNGPCRNGFELPDQASGRVTCTHGPDPAPPGVDVTNRQPAMVEETAPSSPGAAAAPAPSTGFSCYDGSGAGGTRVQLLYVYAAGKTNRYATYANSFQAWASMIDNTFNNSAKETSGLRHVRFLTDAACKPKVTTVQVSATGDDNFDNTISELRAKGYNLDNRKYMVWVDAAVYCGIGEVWPDDSLTTGTSKNLNDGAAGTDGMFARVDTGCWGYAEPHEVMHTMGSVQDSAPHATTHGHCWDEADRMCYDDDATNDGVVDTLGGRHAITNACVASHEDKFDCNHDDYFHTAPAAGSYLATHWNAAKNSFQAINGLPDPPTNLVLDPRSGALTATWKAPASNGGSAVTSYAVGLYDGAVLAQPVYTTPNATTLTKTFTGLTNGKTYTVQVQTKTALGNSLPATGTATPQVLGVSFAAPATLGSPIVVTFTESVQNVTSANLQVMREGTTTPIAATPACKTIQGTAVSCATGPVKAAWVTPSMLTGEHYIATVNPAGAPSTITATTGGATVPTKSSPVLRILSAEENKTTQLWAVVSDAAAKGGSYMVERAATTYATYAFNGTGITWFTMTGPDQGTADVYVDNVLKLTAVNNYSAAKTFGVARTVTGLAAGAHTLKILVKGVKGTASATDTRVVIDAVQVAGAAEVVTPSFGRYWRSVSLAGASGGKYIVDDVAGAYDTIKFRGTAVTVWFVRTSDSGRVTPLVDTTTYAAVDLYNSATGLFGYTFTGLSDTTHTIKLTVAGTKQAASTGTKVGIDRYVVS